MNAKFVIVIWLFSGVLFYTEVPIKTAKVKHCSDCGEM